MDSDTPGQASQPIRPSTAAKADHRLLGHRSAVAALVAMVLVISSLLPAAQAHGTQASQSPREVDVDRIETAADSGYVVQVEAGESATNVLADSDAVDVGETEDLSGEAFNGAVADIDNGQARQLRKDPRVVSVERNKAYTVNSRDRLSLVSPNAVTAPAEDYSAQSATTVWGLDRTDQRNLPLDSNYSPPADGSGVDIYVVDSGIDIDHPEFGDRIGQSAHLESVGDSADDCYGHGTHVAGTAVSSTYGMAKNATVHSVRVLDCSGNGTLSGVVDGLNWVATNAEPKSVVNLSLAGGVSPALDAAVTSLVADGIVVVVAAGNRTTDACTVSPASAGPAITVGALDDADGEASFSNYGTCLDLYGPGVNIRSLLMDQPGSDTTKSGTSMAAPHVAGAAAVMWSDNPLLTSSQVQDLVLSDATTGVVQFPSGQRGSPNLNLHLVSPDTTPPGPVTALNVTDRTPTSITLTWTNPTDTDLAEVIVRRAKGTTAPTTASVGTSVTLSDPTATTVTDSGLDPDTTYTYAVFTKDTTENTSTVGVTKTSNTPPVPTPPVTPPPPSDTTAPNTRITSGTSGKVNSRNARFYFSSTETGSTYECRLDGGAWRRCTSAKSYRGLVNRRHTFRVRGTDRAGNTDASPAVKAFTTARRVKVTLKTRNNRSKLRVDVNPNNVTRNYKIRVQKKKRGKWRTVRTTWTRGTRDRRTINMSRGRYRIKVPAQRGLLGGKSRSVWLRR